MAHKRLHKKRTAETAGPEWTAPKNFAGSKLAPKQHDMLRKGRDNAGFNKGTCLTAFTMPNGEVIMIPKKTRKRGSKFNGGLY